MNDPSSRVIIFVMGDNPRLNMCNNCKNHFLSGEKIFSRGNHKRKRYCLVCAKRFNMI